MKTLSLRRLLCLFILLPLSGATLPVSAAPEAGEPAAVNAPKPPFEDEIVAFEVADKKNTPATGAVLFTGSSSIRLWSTVAADFPELTVMNRGFGGSQLDDNIRYVDRIVIPYKPKMIVLYAGGNDIAEGKTPARVLSDFVTYTDKVHAALPNTRIVYISNNPSTARWTKEPQMLEANRLISRYIAENYGKKGPLSYIDTHSGLLKPDGTPLDGIFRADGLHLNEQGYKIWVALLRPPILKLAGVEPVKAN